MNNTGKQPSSVSRTTAKRADKSSPYRRLPPPVSTASNSGTPSRIGSLFAGLFSPFRSAKKSIPTKSVQRLAPPAAANIVEDGDDDDEYEIEAARQERLSQVSQSEAGDLPEDDDSIIFPSSSSYRMPVETNGSLARKLQDFEATSTPSIASAFVAPLRTSTPRFLAQSTPRREERMMDISPPKQANDVLAEFFRNQGDRPLTAIESAGVMQIIQQSQADTAEIEALPTVFTPNFRARSSSIPSLSRPSTPRNTIGNDLFDTTASDASFSDTTPFRRRRPLYVGAGYSTARRRRQNNASEYSSLQKSTSESALSSFSLPEEPRLSVADGKRRRIDGEEETVSRSTSFPSIPTASTTTSLPFASTSSSTSTPTLSSLPVTSIEPNSTVKPKSSLSSLAQAAASIVSTPVRPSPLWQVSAADTPSPSPPKRPTEFKAPTRAADMIMDIVRQEEAARPLKVTLAVITNPYESENGARPPARPRAVKVTTTPRSRMSASSIPVPKPAVAPVKLSFSQTLERTMPAELRKDASTKSASPAAPAPAPSSVVLPSSTLSLPPAIPTPITVSKLPPAPKILPRPVGRSIVILPPSVKAPVPKKKIQVIEISDSSDDEMTEEPEEAEEEESEREATPVAKEVKMKVVGRSKRQEQEEMIEIGSTASEASYNDEEEFDERENDEDDDEEEEEEEDELDEDEDQVMESEEYSLSPEPLQAPVRSSRAFVPTPAPIVMSSSPPSTAASSRRSSLAPSPRRTESKASLPPPSPTATAFHSPVLDFGSVAKHSPSPLSSLPPVTKPTSVIEPISRSPTPSFSFTASPHLSFTPSSTLPVVPIAPLVSSAGMMGGERTMIRSDEALRLEVTELPLRSLPVFSFQSVVAGVVRNEQAKSERDPMAEGVRKVVKEMSVGELPSITF